MTWTEKLKGPYSSGCLVFIAKSCFMKILWSFFHYRTPTNCAEISEVKMQRMKVDDNNRHYEFKRLTPGE